ncbi:MAG: 30S ribosome-binding factor RbfA [Chloroflexota bacterium]|nr:30S ribosome-binding factor RbfA [Chloroflexota bacterium]MDQ6908626.1 30S ribosome-binding factor RbfA [Chloroflexota bacterium]
MAKSSRRIEQVNDFLRNEIATLIREERDELRLKLVSVTEVQTSADLRHARVYISTLGGERERDAAVETLRRHSRHLRHLLAPRITFRSVPELDFRPDASLETGAAVLRALNVVEHEREINPPHIEDELPPEPAEKTNPRARKRRTED